MANGSGSKPPGGARQCRAWSAGNWLLVIVVIAGMSLATASVASGQSSPLFRSFTGDGARALINSTVTLGATVSGVSTCCPLEVNWTVLSGPGSFNGGRTATTPVPPAGQVSVELQIGSAPGPIQIEARLVGGVCEGTCDRHVLTVTARAPTLTIVSGNNQRGLPDRPLRQPLVVAITGQELEAGGAGRAVNWQVTSGTATLAAARTSTDGLGQARNTLTLGSAVGPVVVTASVAGVPSVTMTFNATAVLPTLAIVSGNNQRSLPGRPLPQPLVVAITGEEGQAGAGRTVTWQVTVGAATLAAASTQTGENGQAQNTVTLGNSSGPVTVIASLAGVPSITVTFKATALLPTLAIVSGNNQRGLPGRPLPQPLVVAIAGQEGEAGAGRTVTWQVTAGAATLAAASTPSGANGQAQNTLTLGDGSAPVVVTASLAGIPAVTVTFSATVLRPTLAVVSGDEQQGAPGQTLPQPLVVAVTSPEGTRASGGRVVSWNVASGAATLATPSTAVGGNGQAQNTLTLGSAAGPVTVRACLGGPSDICVTLRATVLSLTIALVSGNNQTGVLNTALPQPLVVSLTAGGQPAINQVVAWQVTTGDGTLAAATSLTNSGGQAQNTMILGPNATSIVVTASVPGSSAAVDFTVNNATATAVQGIKSFAALGTAALLTSTTQATNIGIRLGALRKGATGVSAGGFSLDVDGQSLPIGAVASLVPGLGGGASADQPGLFSKVGIFLNGQGSFGDQNAVRDQPRFDFHTAGVTLGADYRFTPEFILGTALGYNSTNQTLEASAGDFDTQGISWSAFGTYYIGQSFYVDGIATYSWNQFDTVRTIPADGTVAVATGDTNGRQFALSAGAGYDFRWDKLVVGLQGRVNYINVDIDSFTEQGAGIYDLSMRSQRIESLATYLGPEVSYNFNTPWAILSPTMKAEWVHEFLNNSRAVQGALIADPGGTIFSFRTDEPVRNYMNLGLGLTATFKHGISAFFYYQSILGYSSFTSNAFTGGIRVEF